MVYRANGQNVEFQLIIILILIIYLIIWYIKHQKTVKNTITIPTQGDDIKCLVSWPTV